MIQMEQKYKTACQFLSPQNKRPSFNPGGFPSRKNSHLCLCVYRVICIIWYSYIPTSWVLMHMRLVILPLVAMAFT